MHKSIILADHTVADQTSKKPSSTLKAIRSPICILAANGVKSVRIAVMTIPTPNTIRPPITPERKPPGICIIM